MNKKIIGSLAVAVFILVVFVVSKVVPLKTVTEDFRTETFSLDPMAQSLLLQRLQ